MPSLRLVVLSLLALLTGAAPAAADCGAAVDATFIRGTAKARYLSYVPFVAVTISGHGPYWFLLDTGANRSAIDSALAEELRLPRLGSETVEGSAGVIEAGTVRIDHLLVGEAEAAGVEPTTQDFSGFAGPDGARVSGILGSDVMSGFVVALDFRNERVALLPPDTAADIRRCGRVLPFQLDDGMVLYEARIDGVPLKLRHDSGAGLFSTDEAYVNVTEDQHRPLREADPAATPVETLGGSGVGGSVTLPVYQAGVIEIGPFRRERPRLIVQPRKGYFARPDAVGFAGDYLFWPEGWMVFDYPGRQVILPPARP